MLENFNVGEITRILAALKNILGLNKLSMNAKISPFVYLNFPKLPTLQNATLPPLNLYLNLLQQC